MYPFGIEFMGHQINGLVKAKDKSQPIHNETSEAQNAKRHKTKLSAK